MFEATDIREYRGHKVVDNGGDKVGELEAIYVDTVTDQPAFGTVKLGMVGRQRLAFVPLRDATVGPDYVRVAWDKDVIKDAPSIGTDETLAAAQEPMVFEHYSIPYEQGSSGERRLGRP